MCERCNDNHTPDVNDFGVEDVAGASLVMLGVLVEKYVDDGYCDPQMYKALEVAKTLAGRLADIADEFGDTGVASQARDLVTSFELTRIEAGEVMNEIIERHDLPVLKNTFEIDENHPKFVERLAEMMNEDGED